MDVKKLQNIESEERRKFDEALLKAQARKNILKEKIAFWVKRHPILVGAFIVLILIQFVNAYYKIDRMDRKATAQNEQSIWRQ